MIRLLITSLITLCAVVVVAPSPIPFANQMTFVNKGGNDITGTGAWEKPFLTIQRAMTSIVDASQTKVYSVLVGPGTYNGNFAFKPWVGIVGAPSTSGFEGLTTIGTASVTFDPSWTGSTYDVAWFSHLTFNNFVPFDIQNVDAQLTFFDCLFNSGASFTGHHSGNVNNIIWDNCLSYGPVSVTDCQYFFPIGGTVIYNGAVTLTSTSAVAPSSTTLLGQSCSIGDSPVTFVSGVGSGGAIGDMQGCTVTGTLTLNGASTSYTGTADGIPSTVVLLNGAPPPQFYTFATSIGYAPGNASNWVSPAPTRVQDAIDRIAAQIGPVH